MQVGFLGLGHMGHGMAAKIVAGGHPVDVMAHRNRDAVDDMVRRGAREAASLAEMAGRAEVILLCVPHAGVVDGLLNGDQGIGEHARPGTVIVDCTTSRPDGIRSLAGRYPHLAFLDAPLGRSPAEAWMGRLSVMVGGAADTIERVRPVFECFADEIQIAGPLGSGHTLKLVNNFISMGYAALYSEALAFACASGLSPADFDRVIGSSRMACPFFETFMGWVRRGDASSHRFALHEAQRTVGDIRDHAGAFGLKLKLPEAIAAAFDAAMEQGYGDADLPELPRAVARREGIELRPVSEG